MKEILCNSAYFGVTVSLIGYGAGIMLKKKFKYAFLNPLLISIIFVIGVVMLCGVDYESYENSAQYLSYLLTPATVCLAVPLYQQMTLLKKNLAAVACGILAGVLASLGSVFWHFCSDLSMMSMLRCFQSLSQQQSEWAFPKNWAVW